MRHYRLGSFKIDYLNSRKTRFLSDICHCGALLQLCGPKMNATLNYMLRRFVGTNNVQPTPHYSLHPAALQIRSLNITTLIKSYNNNQF